MAKPNTRTLILPNGGTMEIPLPGTKGRFEINPPTLLGGESSRLPTLLAGILIGGVVGVTAAVWLLRRA